MQLSCTRGDIETVMIEELLGSPLTTLTIRSGPGYLIEPEISGVQAGQTGRGQDG